MTWEEYQKMTKILLQFWELNKQQQEQIMLMIDGLLYRAKHAKT